MVSFEKVGECLYRYVPTGKYYGRFEVNGREVRRSLGTTDRALARRKLQDLQRTLSRTTAGGDRLTLAALCERYLDTARSQAAATIYRKEAIARRIKADGRAGRTCPSPRSSPRRSPPGWPATRSGCTRTTCTSCSSATRLLWRWRTD